AHYAELRHRIGLVPQEDVIYPHLTPRRALGYAAELRFPGDTSDQERSVRVQEVLDELRLTQTTKDRPEPAADTSAATLSGGEKVFYGPSDEGLRYFGKSRWVEVYRALRTEPERDWAGEFRQSDCYRQYVASGLKPHVPDPARAPSEPPPAPRSRLAQLAILCRRYTALIAADRGFLISLAIAPLVFGG